MSDLKPQAESLESLLSTAIGLLMGHKERIGYKPDSVIAKFVDECVERLKDWPYTDGAQPEQAHCPNGDKCKHGSWCSETYCQEQCKFKQPTQLVPLRQILTDPENQPNQYGVEFLMRGPKFAFRVGNRQFTLDYEPTEPGEFEFMRDMLINAFSTFTPDVKTAQAVPPLTEREIVKCLTASGCVGTVKMSYDSGPYEITRTSINADRLARAIEQAVRSKLGAGAPMRERELECVIADLTAESKQLRGLLTKLIDIEGPQPGTAEWADEVRETLGIVGKEGA